MRSARPIGRADWHAYSSYLPRSAVQAKRALPCVAPSACERCSWCSSRASTPHLLALAIVAATALVGRSSTFWPLIALASPHLRRVDALQQHRKLARVDLHLRHPLSGL